MQSHAHASAHAMRGAQKACLVWLEKLQGVWQITRLKEQRFLFIYLFIYLFFVYCWQIYNWTYTHIKKRLAVHKGKPLMTLIEVNTKCAYLEAH